MCPRNGREKERVFHCEKHRRERKSSELIVPAAPGRAAFYNVVCSNSSGENVRETEVRRTLLFWLR